MALDTSSRPNNPARGFLARRLDDLIVLAVGLGLALPFLVPLS